MEKCDYCEKTINNEIPWTCKRCGKTFCGDHRLPEAHDCQGIKNKNFFEPLTKESDTKSKSSKSKSDEGNYEMYIPGRKKHSLKPHFRKKFNLQRFLKEYFYPRLQPEVEPHLKEFLIIFIIGIILNYVYYQTFSLSYLFIGGVNEWFGVLIPTLNYGFTAGYDLFYLIINGIYYAYFYYTFVLVVYYTIINLNKKDTWIMLGWFALILLILFHIFPQIV